ncbi:MAG TPA: hypothetical protein QGF58_12590 [Myxococcota bacterium]|nr:hypothetical protein [Myxococcota bacterium]
MRWRLIIFGWLVVIGILLGLRPWAEARSGFTPKGVERVVLFALSDGDEASFRVGRSEEGLRLLTYLETDRPDTLDEAETWLYCVGLEFVAEERTVFREHWTRSRLTLLEDEEPATRSPDEGRVITDSRIIDLVPGEHMSEGGALVVRPKSLRPGERILVRVFRVEQDPGVAVVAALSRTARERIGRLYPLPWPRLSDAELRYHTGLKRTTLPAADLTGDTVAVLRYAIPSLAPSSMDWGYRLEPGEATAVNIRGPAVLDVLAAGDDHQQKPRPSTLLIELVDASPEPVQGGLVTPSSIEVPAGAVWSLRWFNGWASDAVTLSFVSRPEQGQSWGEPPGAGGGEAQEPERRRITAYRAGPELGPVDVPVVAAREWGLLRVEARPLADDVWKAAPAADPGQMPTTIGWQALDADGEVLDEGEWAAAFDHAPFERYVEVDTDEQIYEPVSEKTTRYLYHRREAVTLRFSADRLVDLRFLYPLDVQPLRAPEYGLPSGFIGRYAPWELAPYVAVAPRNHDQLVIEERLQRFDATVRIERRSEDDDVSARHTFVVFPWNTDEQHPVVEPLRKPKPWESWQRTLMDGLRVLQIGEEGLVVDYRVADDDVGREVGVSCGDERYEPHVLDVTTGTLEWAVPEGEASCELEAPPGLYLAKAEGDGRRWGRRTLWRADDRTLRVTAWIDEPSELIYVRAYTASGQAPELTITIDDGAPQRRATATTSRTADSKRFTPLEEHPQRAQLVNGGTLVAWQGMRFSMGDDLARGRHQLAIHATGVGGEPVYVRMDATWHQKRADDVRHWTEEQ